MKRSSGGFLYAITLVSVLQISVYGYKPPPKVIKPKEIVLEVDSIIYPEGDNFLGVGKQKKIGCRVTNSFEKLEWYDPSGNIVTKQSSGDADVYVQDTVGPSKSKSHALNLIFPNLEVKHSGEWECRSGERKKIIPICVLDPAVFEDVEEDETRDEGLSVTLSCEAFGNPEPKIQWYRGSSVQPVSEEPGKIYTGIKYNHRGFESLLTIKSLTPEDGDTYYCEATQELPDVQNCSYVNSVNITLNVNHKPRFPTNGDEDDSTLEFVFAKENESVDLLCDASAYPTPKFKWFREVNHVLYPEKQFQLSDDETHSSFVIIGNSSTYGQRYICSAANKFGETTKTFKIFKMQKPDKLIETRVSNATETVVFFEFNFSTNDHAFPINGYDVQYFEKSTPVPTEAHWRSAQMFPRAKDKSTDFGTSLEGLQPGKDYWVRIRAYNELGYGDWSFPIVAGTLVESHAEDIEVGDELNNSPWFLDKAVLVGVLVTIGIVLFGLAWMSIIKKI